MPLLLPSSPSRSAALYRAPFSSSSYVERLPLLHASSHGAAKIRALEVRSSFSSLSIDPASLTSSVASFPAAPFKPDWILERRHIDILNVAACVVAISTAWLFFFIIPALRSFKSAAESLEQQLDAAAEELPDTMAAIRLSGVEINDLTVELRDLGQDITRGVRNSTQAVRVAEDRLRRIVAISSPDQRPSMESKEMELPGIAKSARGVREGIARGRAAFGVLVGIIRFSRWARSFLNRRSLKNSP